MIENGIKSKKFNRCERCKLSHKKCDLSLPSCSRCIKRNVECFYNDKIRYRRRKAIPETNFFCFKLKQIDLEYKVNQDIRKRGKKYQSSNKLGIMEVSKSITEVNSFMGYILKLPRVGPLENLFTLVQHPSLTQMNDNLELLFKLIEKLGLLRTKKIAVKQQIISRRPKTLPLSLVLEQAIINFFKFNNKVFPIFLEDGFDFFSKPLVLRLTILASGLMWMEVNSSTEYLVSYLSFHIHQKLLSIHLLKPTLEIFQTILILLTGFYTPNWVVFMRSFLNMYCDKLSTLLGLHIPRKGAKQKQELERAMAYSCFNIVCQGYLATQGYHHHQPNIRPEFIFLDDSSIEKLKYDLDLSSDLIDSIILHSFYSELSPIIFAIGMLKTDFLLSRVSYELLNKLSSRLLVKIQSIQSKYLNYYSALYASLPSLLDYHRFILFNCHYLRFFIYSIFFYHPSASGFNNQSQFHINIEIIYKSQIECKQVIELGALLPHYFHLKMGLIYISQCLVFLVRFSKYSKAISKDTIQIGLDLFKSIKYPILSKLAQFNLPFIALVKFYNDS